MFFDLTDDQLALQAGIHQFCEDRLPMSVVRSLIDSGGVDRGLWGELGAMGLFGLRLPEDSGGAGLGWPDAAIIFEELGRAAVPGPLVATHLASSWVDGAADGERIVGAVEVRPGQPAVVEHFEALDAVVVLSGDELRLVERTEIQAVPVDRPLDPLTPVHRVVEMGSGEALGGPEEAAAWRLGGATLTAAMQVGMAGAVLDQAVAYAKERYQFQRPIGSFQAVKHPLADGLVRADVARAAVHAAAVVLQEPDGQDPVRSVSTAKLVAGEAALENAKMAVQVNGAMGFTWELDVHLFLKRAWVLDTHYGSVDHHAAVVAGAA